MVISYEIFFPPGFFDSASRNKNNESISERIVRVILSNLLQVSIDDIKRGDESKREPDYVYEETGYEVTFAIEPDIIKMINTGNPSSVTIGNESTLIKNIALAVQKKNKKEYSLKTKVVVLCINHNPFWEEDYEERPAVSILDLEEAIINSALAKFQILRNTFFENLYHEYIETHQFEDIIIINLTGNKQITYLSIHGWNRRLSNARVIFTVSNDKALPYCKRLCSIYDGKSQITNLYHIKKGVISKKTVISDKQ